MAQQKAHVHEIEAVVERLFANVERAKLDVVYPLSDCLPAGQVKLCFVDIYPDHLALRADPPSQLNRHVTAALTDMEEVPRNGPIVPRPR